MKKAVLVIFLHLYLTNYIVTSPYLTLVSNGDSVNATKKSPSLIAFTLLAEDGFEKLHADYTFKVTKPQSESNAECQSYDSTLAFIFEYARKKRKSALKNLLAAEHWFNLANYLNESENHHLLEEYPDCIKKARLRAYSFLDHTITMQGKIPANTLLAVDLSLNKIIRSAGSPDVTTPKKACLAKEVAIAKLYRGIIMSILAWPGDSAEGTNLIFESLKSDSLPKKYREKAFCAFQDILQEKGVISDTF